MTHSCESSRARFRLLSVTLPIHPPSCGHTHDVNDRVNNNNNTSFRWRVSFFFFFVTFCETSCGRRKELHTRRVPRAGEERDSSVLT